MSAAIGVTSGQDAQRPGSDGATIADAMTPERARLAMHERGTDRDRNAFDDEDHRRRNRNAVEARPGTEHKAAVDNEPQSLSVEQYLDIAKQALQLVSKAESISPASVENYTRKSEHLLAAFDQCTGDDSSRWEAVLQPHAAKSNSFFAMRAAAAWHIRQQLRALLNTLQAQVQMTLSGLDKAEWHKTMRQIEQHTTCLRAVKAVDRRNLLESSGSKSIKATSKRADLWRFANDWPDQMVKASECDTYGDAIWVLANTGCRPEELLKGVELRPAIDRITVRILGAKVGRSSGQSWRELGFNWRSVPIGLVERLAGGESFIVRIVSTAALRKAVAAVGRRLWPTGKRVCPYHFRHQLAEDMRESGWTADEIAAALGQRVGETSSYYGRRSRQGQGGVAREPSVVRGCVRTAMPVRPTAPFDPASIPAKQQRRTRLAKC